MVILKKEGFFMSANITKAAANFWASLVTQAWEDENFKQRLLAEPETVLQDQGYGSMVDARGEKITIKVVEATGSQSCAYDPDTNTLTFYLPERPDCLKQLMFNGQFTAGMCC
jgi:hypothetical protein